MQIGINILFLSKIINNFKKMEKINFKIRQMANEKKIPIRWVYQYPIPFEVLSLSISEITSQNSKVLNFVAEMQNFLFNEAGIFVDFRDLRKIVLIRLRDEKKTDIE